MCTSTNFPRWYYVYDVWLLLNISERCEVYYGLSATGLTGVESENIDRHIFVFCVGT